MFKNLNFLREYYLLFHLGQFIFKTRIMLKIQIILQKILQTANVVGDY